MLEAAITVLIVLTSTSTMNNLDEPTGFWLSELTHPYYAMVENDIKVDIASIKGGAAPIDPRSENEQDPYNEKFLANVGLMHTLKNTKALGDIDPTEYDAIVFAGGHGTMWDFPSAPSVQEKAMAIYNQNGYIAAICHGPAALVNLKKQDGEYLVSGKKVAGFTNKEESIVGLTAIVPFLLQDKLIERGARFQEAEPWSTQTVIDGRLITGQNPQSAHQVGVELSRLLRASE